MKAFITDVGTKLMNQLEQEVGQGNIILGLATYSQAITSEDMDK